MESEEIVKKTAAEVKQAPEVQFQIPGDEHFEELKRLIESEPRAAIVCEARENNPNYFSIVFANQIFYENFGIKEFNLIGKSYDFLFEDLDLDYSSEDQIEYVRLVKSVKDFHESFVVISVLNHKEKFQRTRFKISFIPHLSLDGIGRHGVFTFEKVDDQTPAYLKSGDKKVSSMLLKNLERTLANERLLREVGGFIISDLEIREIAQNIANILCRHLRVDRCLIHDYRNSGTSFVVEHCDSNSLPMLGQDIGTQVLTDYLNFQNHFFQRFGDKAKKTSISIVEDVLGDWNFAKILPICEKFSIISQVAATTSFNAKVNGGIYLHQSSKRSWLSDEIELIETVAEQFSIAVDRSSSIERVMVTNHALIEKTTQLKETLEHEQEMRRMQNEFVALVSHEFKTPLQIIDGTREVLSRKMRARQIADETIDKSLDKIKSAIQRMNGLIMSTLNLAKMENEGGMMKPEMSNFDLRKFIFDIVERNSNLAANKSIEIVTKINDLPTSFMGDPKLLDHSFTNVISNAIKYSKNDTVVKILAKSNDKKIALRVIDQGIGIPKEDLADIGKKFFRAKNTLAVAGTGIGIYLTKHFVELHGGNVLIESEVDVGTSVTITLPRTA